MQAKNFQNKIIFDGNVTIEDVEAVSTAINAIKFIHYGANDEEWKAIFKALSHKKHISTLEFTHCNIGGHSRTPKAELAFSKLQHITCLTMCKKKLI